MNRSQTHVDERTVSRIFSSIAKTLEHVFPGLFTRIDWYFYHKYGESFLKHLISNPAETVEELLSYYGGGTLRDNETAKYILYVVLKHFFHHNRALYEEAFQALLKEDWDTFKEITSKYLKHLSTTF